MNIKLQTNEQLSAMVTNGLAGVFVNGVSLSASLSGKSDLTALQNYYTKSETSSANEISTALENVGGKVYFDNRISGIIGSNDLSVVKLSADEYAQMLDDGTCLSNAIYIVDAPNIDAFKQQIKNVAPPTDLSDAATKEYVDNAIPVDLSAFTNSPGYLTEHQSLSNYYTKNETSSAIQISSALSAKSTVSFNRITTSGTNIGSITIDGTTTQIYAPTGGGGSSRYALETAQLVADNGSLTCAVNDQAITTIQVSSSSTPIVVQLPAQPEDGARDFILRIEISSSSAPTFTFNGVSETIDFDSEDDDWAVMEPGLNLVSFTETKRNG